MSSRFPIGVEMTYRIPRKHYYGRVPGSHRRWTPMQIPFQQADAPPSPLYVRCEPLDGPFAIELKLEVVTTIAAEINAASRGRAEIGGILIGVLPTPGNPVLRINDVQMRPRRAGDQG